MDLGLGGKVAMVTGGAGGIGRAICRGLLLEGVRVGVLDLREDAVAEMVSGGECQFGLAGDASVPEQVRRVAEELQGKLGQIDILVNAVGVPDAGEFEALDWDRWERVWRINLMGVVLACREVAPSMKARRYGKIVNIGSLTGRVRGLASASYSCSKAAVHRLTVQLASELAPFNINVNAIAPGIVLTPMSRAMPQERLQQAMAAIPLGRAGSPEDVADLTLFLASDRSSFMTGAILDLNGGAYMHG